MEDKDIGAKPVSDWQPITNKADLAVLGKFIEELTECAGIVARAIIQGMGETEPETGKPNKEALEDEVADVMAMAAHVMNRFQLDRKRIHERTDRKFTWKGAWFAKLNEEGQG